MSISNRSSLAVRAPLLLLSSPESPDWLPAPSLRATAHGGHAGLHHSADVLVCSTRPVPRLTDLRADELAELMQAVQRVGRVVERAYTAEGLTIACQVSELRHLPATPIFADGLCVCAGRACIRTDRTARSYPRHPAAYAG